MATGTRMEVRDMDSTRLEHLARLAALDLSDSERSGLVRDLGRLETLVAALPPLPSAGDLVSDDGTAPPVEPVLPCPADPPAISGGLWPLPGRRTDDGGATS